MQKIFRFILLLAFLEMFAPLSAQISKKRGKVKARHANGVLAEKGRVRNYQKEGTWSYWDTTGLLVKQTHFVNGRRNGLETGYYPNQRKKTEAFYRNDIPQGLWRVWYPNDTLKNKFQYENGKLNGMQRSWHENGKPESVQIFQSGELISSETWLSNGRILSREHYKQTLKDGEWREYTENPDEDTTTVWIRNYTNGQANGGWFHYQKGVLINESHYTNNQLNGQQRIWNDIGKLLVDENYVLGQLDGKQNYYDDGLLIRSENWSMGTKNGRFDAFDHFNGKLIQTSWFSNNQLDSTITWHSNGKPASIRRAVSTKNEEISYAEYDSSHLLLLRGQYTKNLRVGSWISYYPNGKPKAETSFTGGRVNGIYRRWYSSGQLMVEVQYRDNIRVGLAKIWTEKGKPIAQTTKYYQDILDSSLPGDIYTSGEKNY